MPIAKNRTAERTDSTIGQAIDEVRAELARVDTKAQTLLTLAGIALTAGVALPSWNNLPLTAAVTGWVTLSVIAVAVALLATAVRPALGGNHGFVRYARTPADDLIAQFSTCPNDGYWLSHEAYRLRWLSLATLAKFRRVRAAVDLLVVGLAGTAVTTVVALVG